MALALTIGLAWVLMSRRRTLQKARAADIYWQEKRRFLEERAAADAIDAPPEDWSGRLLDDRFLLEERIAAGGFAAVYRAADRAHNGEPVAVKLLHPLCDNEAWRRRRFVDEVAALAEAPRCRRSRDPACRRGRSRPALPGHGIHRRHYLAGASA